jgi:hypothetical protein
MNIQIQAQELRMLEVKQRLKMKLILFYFILTASSVAFILLVISTFLVQAAPWVKLAFFLFNGVLGGSIRALHLHLFPKAQ